MSHQLVHDGVIGAWTYTEEAQRTLASLPVRHWLGRWQETTIIVTPVEAMRQHYAGLASAARQPRARTAHA